MKRKSRSNCAGRLGYHQPNPMRKRRSYSRSSNAANSQGISNGPTMILQRNGSSLETIGSKPNKVTEIRSLRCFHHHESVRVELYGGGRTVAVGMPNPLEVHLTAAVFIP